MAKIAVLELLDFPKLISRKMNDRKIQKIPHSKGGLKGVEVDLRRLRLIRGDRRGPEGVLGCL